MKFAIARILQRFNDRDGAITRLKECVDIDSDALQSRLLLANMLVESELQEDALKHFRELMSQGYNETDKIDRKVATTVLVGYLRCLRDTAQIDELCSVTEKWNEAQSFRSLLGCFYVTGLKRAAEPFSNKDPNVAHASLVKALITAEDLLNESYIRLQTLLPVVSVIEEYDYLMGRHSARVGKESYKTSIKMLGGVVPRLDELLIEHRYSNMTHFREVLENLEKFEENGRPIRALLESRRNRISPERMTELEEEGYVLCEIYSVPQREGQGQPTFLFAQDKGANQYFVHFESTDGRDWPSWCNLGVGDSVLIKPGTRRSEDKAIPAQETMIPGSSQSGVVSDDLLAS